ncbi:MAG: dihydrofolate reductase [Patescibacteria group bacterium]|nr:dihydrofolate reductase [Patescibacteria group bacterium]
MKCFLIAAMTADGYIAKDDAHSPFGWTSKEDKKRFIELSKKAGVVVMGSKTYATIGKPLKERLNIVYSHDKTFEGVETTQKPPLELLQELESRGFKEVAVCGGSHIYTMFMKAGVVGKIYLTIEPLVFGKGMRLFDDEMHYALKLKSAGQAENGTLLLEYDVDFPVK